MKTTKGLLFGLILFGIGQAKGQDYAKPASEYGIRPGTIVTLDGKTTEGYVFNAVITENQKKCIFYKDYKDSRTQKNYLPEELLEYSIENDHYKSISYSGALKFGKADKHFIYVAKPGIIAGYVFWAPEEQFFWAKANEEPVAAGSLFLGFKKNMLKLIGDDAELAAKVERKEKGYGPLNVLDIINEYNKRAETKKNN